MYLKEFPNINWLKNNASQDFAGGRDYHGNSIATKGWPNVILNVKSAHTERDHIKGPFSLFYNLEGKSLVGLDKKWYPVSNGFYCLSNDGQPYHLHVPKGETAITSNIHFRRALFEDVIQTLSHSTGWVLDNVGNINIGEFETLPKTELMSDDLRAQFQLLHDHERLCSDHYSADKEYEITSSILELLLLNAKKKLKNLGLIGAQKAATRKELFNRINIGIDYMHSNRLMNLDLDDISKNCGLSKFHFIRVFKEVYNQTPTHYIAQLQAKQAQRLILASDSGLNEIALQLGFSELSAFTRFYKRMTGRPPSSIRKSN